MVRPTGQAAGEFGPQGEIGLAASLLEPAPNASVWRLLPNRWDFVAFPLLIGLMALLAIAYHESVMPIAALETHTKEQVHHSNLFHTILGIAGITTPLRDPARDLTQVMP